ncbi:Tll0287-like domain-containing protein [Roseibacillus persicicus]|uniref:Tll0287-like domain-containing protein n=1 Tax=Roseibacillus persicicus TaxID=454148 RepID=UPI001674BFFC|nr:DUF3365 domain-containing protein [Roseibacillus persicicus]
MRARPTAKPPFQKIPLLLGLACLSLFSCRKEEPTIVATSLSPAQEQAVVQQGTAASQALMKTLGGQLKAALQSGGPENALQVCQSVAQPLTAQTSETQARATVTRTASRFRNPLNQPDATDKMVLAEWEKMISQGKELPPHRIFPIDEHQALFYKPIPTEAICLKCHGDPATFSPALAAKIKEAYPQDQATGFQEGDLRGVFRVLVNLEPSLPSANN